MIEKPNIKKVLEEIIPKGLNQIAKIGKGHKVTFIWVRSFLVFFLDNFFFEELKISIKNLSNNKNVDIKYSAHNTYLEWPSSGTINIERLESQII